MTEIARRLVTARAGAVTIETSFENSPISLNSSDAVGYALTNTTGATQTVTFTDNLPSGVTPTRATQAQMTPRPSSRAPAERELAETLRADANLSHASASQLARSRIPRMERFGIAGRAS
ncbi:MAG: hypothetical protein ACRDLT_04445 [Solirubrobacteraceae bacterium]